LNCSTLAKFVAGPALILAFLVGCAAAPTPNRQTLPPTLNAAQLEATSGAIAQAARRAQATLDTQATADSRAVTPGEIRPELAVYPVMMLQSLETDV
jgi:hypothetical protein